MSASSNDADWTVVTQSRGMAVTTWGRGEINPVYDCISVRMEVESRETDDEILQKNVRSHWEAEGFSINQMLGLMSDIEKMRKQRVQPLKIQSH